MRVVIVGAGIVGASLAYHLSKGGAKVHIFEAQRPGNGTSLATFSYLNAVRFGGDYGRLRVQAVDYWHQLSSELQAEQFVHCDGSVYYIDNDEDVRLMEEHVAESSAVGLSFERMRAATFVKDFEPNLIFPEAGFPVYRMPGEGWLESVPMIGRLLLCAELAGTTVSSGVKITRIEQTASGYKVAGNEIEVEADRVILCGGPGTAAVLEILGAKLPVQTRSGVTVVTKPLPIGLKHVVYAGKVHFKPDGGGRLVAGRTDYRPVHPGVDAAQEAGRETAALVQPWLRHFGQSEIEAVRVGVRPIPADGVPAVGELAGHPGVSVAVMHSGVSLSGLIGREHANEILTGRLSELLHAYRPDRFLEAHKTRDDFAPWAPGDLISGGSDAPSSTGSHR
ncbi:MULTISPECIES: NAD(P)/FAD-dependent oxidoreductase [Paraburkholderia]|uniref:FAD-binding oxidoreductase n=1 Tax=Paraburkholderia podalyriae TaxID=1938811 RepID=A0ABR7PU73_9BURK|nr:FAD-binding oxidoreductase [Paraburkholderia podalyriae]MBC8749781.1 FAD-binding oxidoreductase [Paraburkholderia podalyriae]